MTKNEVFALDAEFVDFAEMEALLAACDYENELADMEFERIAMQKAALAYENRFWWRDDMEVAA